MPSFRLRQPLRHRPRGAVATVLRVSALVVALVALVAPVAPGVGADPATAATPGSAAASGVVTSGTTAPVGPGGYVGLSPTRLFDSAENPPLDGDTSQWPHLRQLLVTGRAGVPATNVSAVLLNVTVANTQQAGYLTVFPTGSPQPTASNLNWNARGATTADLVLAKVGTGGLVSFVQSGYDADTRLIVDLTGYVVGGPGPTVAGGTGYRYRSGSFTVVPIVLTGPPSALTGVATPAPVTRVWDVVVDAVQCASSGRCYLQGSVRTSPTSTPFVLHEPAG